MIKDDKTKAKSETKLRQNGRLKNDMEGVEKNSAKINNCGNNLNFNQRYCSLEIPVLN